MGTDSHTTMVNALGVFGWGVGGIEAEAAMLGQPSFDADSAMSSDSSCTDKLPEGATATDLVLTVTEMLRKKGVVGKFVEFFGTGLSSLSLPDRATIANMAPEYGATMGFFPVDEETLAYLQFTARHAGADRAGRSVLQGTRAVPHRRNARSDFHRYFGAGSGTVEPTLAGPKRPAGPRVIAQGERVRSRKSWKDTPAKHIAVRRITATRFDLSSGAVVIAAITSCTNTSNPSLMLGAGLLAKKAVERGLHVKPWVKTSLAPGSKVVTDYLTRRADDISRQSEFSPGGLRMHDLHRQQRTVAGSDWRGDQGQQSGGGFRAERQSKF